MKPLAVVSLLILAVVLSHAQPSDSLYVAFFPITGSAEQIGIVGLLFPDNCDSVRVDSLIFTWGMQHPPVDVGDPNWVAVRGHTGQQQWQLPPTVPGPPTDVHLWFWIWPDGVRLSASIDPLSMSTPYAIAPPCNPTGFRDQDQHREFKLLQNYPNPFNPNTRILYRIGSRVKVEMKVFDLLGRTVATLVDDVKDAGEYSVRFDANGLASGVYLYRLVAGSFSETRMLFLIR